MTAFQIVGLFLQLLLTPAGRKALDDLLLRHENFVAELKQLRDSRVAVKKSKGY